MPCPNANDKRKKMPGGINYNPLKSFNMFFPKKESPFENTNTPRTWTHTWLDKCEKNKGVEEGQGGSGRGNTKAKANRVGESQIVKLAQICNR